MDYIDAIKRPYQLGWRTFFLFILFSIIPIAHLMAGGFALRTAQLAIKGKPAEPWQNSGNLFRLGAGQLLICLVYMIPTMLWLLLCVLVGVLLYASTESKLFIVGLVIIGIMIFIPLIILTLYMVSAAMMAYAAADTVGAAFRFRHVARKAFTMKFFLGSLIVLVIGMGYGVILLPLMFAFAFLQFFALLVPFAIIPVIMIRILVQLSLQYPIMVSGNMVLGDAWRQIKN